LFGSIEAETVGREKSPVESANPQLNVVELYPGAEGLKQGAFEGRFSVGSTSYSNLTKYGATLTVEMLDAGTPGTDESHIQVKGGKADELEFLIPQELQGPEFGNALHKLMESLPDFKTKEFGGLVDRHLGYHISKVKDQDRQVKVRQRLLDSLPIWLQAELSRHDSAVGHPFALQSIPKAKCLAEVRFSFAATIDAKARDDIDAAFATEFSQCHGRDAFKQILANLRLGAASTPLPGEKNSGFAEKKHRLSYAIDGLLNGSIDLFFQEPTSGRYFILDWKTNRLGISLEDYGDDAMAAEMLEAKYHLQFAIYSMVADEYMRSRLGARWDYQTHFGGAYYLFLRAFGIEPNGRRDLGVFYHRPSPEFLEKLRLAVGRPTITTAK
jgi:ATP-dependent exoDNAse (exonuclease V) beta subunit